MTSLILSSSIFAYYRFSSREQAEGTSIARQRGDCQRFAAQLGLTIEHELIDEGRSAFSGKHRELGSALGQFEAEVKAGLHCGATVIIERIDRLSRQGFDEAYGLVRAFLRNGVTIAIADGGDVYRAGESLELVQIMTLVIKAAMAHEESVKKSERLSRRYEIRRAEAQAKGTVMSRNMPAWLERGRNGRAVVRLGRDVVVKRIFDLADAGHGSGAIARIINAEFEPWGDAPVWTRARIVRILSDRQVTGEYQPMRKEGEGKVPAGAAWPNHFPTVITIEQFERVSAAAAGRKLPAGRKSGMVANLFAGLLRCACGAPMTYQCKRKAGSIYYRRPNGAHSILKHDEARLRCSRAEMDGQCRDRTSVAYYGFERALLDACLHLALDDRSFQRRDEVGRLSGLVAEKRRAHVIATDNAKSMWDAYRKTKSNMAMADAVAAEAEAETLADEIVSLEADLRRASGEADAEAHLSRVAEFRRHLYDDDADVRREHRQKVQQGFRAVIQSVTFHRGTATIVFVGDQRFMTVAGGKIVRNHDLQIIGKPLSDDPKVRAYQKRNAA